MIDINNRQEIEQKLKTLNSDSPAIWGQMTAQHMVEHLTFAVMFSNGGLDLKLYFPKDKADYIKNAVIYTDKELPRGFKAPMLGDELPKLECKDIQTAIDKLFSELENFDKHFINNPDVRPVNPTMGELDRQEWIKFHDKHFTHHFRQFDLI